MIFGLYTDKDHSRVTVTPAGEMETTFGHNYSRFPDSQARQAAPGYTPIHSHAPKREQTQWGGRTGGRDHFTTHYTKPRSIKGSKLESLAVKNKK